MAESLISSATQSANNLIADGHPPVTLPITLVSGRSLSAGTVLGKVTASGKYAEYNVNLSDGTEEAVAILAEDLDASDGDVNGNAYFHGVFNNAEVQIAAVSDGEATYSDVTAAATADLKSVGIFLKEVL